KNLWIDIGYEVKDGELEDGQEVSLRRTSKSSPAFLENHSTPEDLISFEAFKSEAEQTAWLVKAIEQNLKADELLPDDIVVINPDPITTRDAVKDARRILLEKGINSNLAGVTSSVDVFLEPGTVTFTGVFRAKGNEAAMVYVINAQDCFTAFLPGDVARVRNRLFTAITRSKAWVRILGFGKGMEALKAEFERAKATNFELRFKYPTDAERKQMTIVNRDMSKEEKDRFAKKQNSLRDIIESLESGDTFIEDYPEEIIKKLLMKAKETLNQVGHLTTTMVGLSLSNDQNFASTHGDVEGDFEITVNNATKMSVALKNIAYCDIYQELVQARCYNLKMLDGALITLR